MVTISKSPSRSPGRGCAGAPCAVGGAGNDGAPPVVKPRSLVGSSSVGGKTPATGGEPPAEACVPDPSVGTALLMLRPRRTSRGRAQRRRYSTREPAVYGATFSALLRRLGQGWDRAFGDALLPVGLAAGEGLLVAGRVVLDLDPIGH